MYFSTLKISHGYLLYLWSYEAQTCQRKYELKADADVWNWTQENILGKRNFRGNPFRNFIVWSKKKLFFLLVHASIKKSLLLSESLLCSRNWESINQKEKSIEQKMGISKTKGSKSTRGSLTLFCSTQAENSAFKRKKKTQVVSINHFRDGPPFFPFSSPWWVKFWSFLYL